MNISLAEPLSASLHLDLELLAWQTLVCSGFSPEMFTLWHWFGGGKPQCNGDEDEDHRMYFSIEKLLSQFCPSVNFHFLCYLNAVQLERTKYRLNYNCQCIYTYCDNLWRSWTSIWYLLNRLNDRILAAWVKHSLFYWHRVARHRVDEHWGEKHSKLSDTGKNSFMDILIKMRHLCFLRSRLHVCVWIGTDDTWWDKVIFPSTSAPLKSFQSIFKVHAWSDRCLQVYMHEI